MEIRQKTKLLLISSILIVSAAYSFHKIANLDFWLHLKAGEYILGYFVIPDTNIFNYPSEGHRWLNVYWIFQITIFLVHKIAGISGLILSKVAIFALCVWLLYKAGEVDSASPHLNALALILCIMAANERFIIRPEMFSLLFIALYFFALQLYIRKRKRIIWLIPLFQLFWVNMHGLHVLGLFVILSFIVGEIFSSILRKHFDKTKLKTLSLVFGLSLLACLFALYGHDELFLLAKGTYRALSLKNIPELISPFSSRAGFGTQEIFFYKLLLVVSACSFVLRIRHLNWSHLILYVGFFYLSLQARRNIPYFAVVAGPIMAINLTRSLAGLTFFKEKKWPLETCGAYIIFGLSILLLFDVASNDYYIRNRSNKRFGLGISPATYPIKAVDFIMKNQIKGPVLNDSSVGSYFVWRMYPRQKAFVDGRLAWGDKYLSYFYLPQHFQRIAKSYQLNYVILGHGWSSKLYGLITALHKSKDWTLVYFDEVAVIFVRSSAVNKAVIDRHAANLGLKSYPANLLFQRFPVGHFHLGNLFVALGQSTWAKAAFEYCIEVFPDYFEAHLNLACLYNELGQLKLAERHYLKALDIKPKLAQAHSGLGEVYLKGRQFEKAIKAYKTASSLDKQNLSLRRTLVLLYLNEGRRKDAMSELEKILEINPQEKIAKAFMGYSSKPSR